MSDRLPLPPLPLLDGTTLQVSSSSLSTMQACPMMAAWKMLWKRQPAGASMAADAGKAFHAALQARSEGRQQVFGETEYCLAAKALTDAYESIQVPDDDYRTGTRMLEVLDAYRAEYPSDPWNVLATEMPFAVPLGQVELCRWVPFETPTIDIVYRGLIDLLVEQDGAVFVVDRKTSAEWSPMTLNRYRQSAQFRSYAWVVQELHRTGLVPELPATVHGALVDAIVIRKPSTSTRATKPREEFHRERFYYDQATLAEWRTNALGIVRSWLQQYADGRFTMNDQTCANHYGRPCGYLTTCELPVEHRLTMLSTDVFTDVVPGPLDQPANEPAL